MKAFFFILHLKLNFALSETVALYEEDDGIDRGEMDTFSNSSKHLFIVHHLTLLGLMWSEQLFQKPSKMI